MPDNTRHGNDDDYDDGGDDDDDARCKRYQ